MGDVGGRCGWEWRMAMGMAKMGGAFFCLVVRRVARARAAARGGALRPRHYWSRRGARKLTSALRQAASEDVRLPKAARAICEAKGHLEHAWSTVSAETGPRLYLLRTSLY